MNTIPTPAEATAAQAAWVRDNIARILRAGTMSATFRTSFMPGLRIVIAEMAAIGWTVTTKPGAASTLVDLEFTP